MAKGRATFYLGEELLAMVSEEAMKVGKTSSEVVRRCISTYFSQYHDTELEKEVSERAMNKRARDMEMDKPKDLHDGTMRLITIWESIENEKQSLERIGIVTEDDYDHWINLLEENRKPLSKYEGGERLSKKVDMLIEKLREEKSKWRR